VIEELIGISPDRGVLSGARPGTGKETIENPTECVGNWWDNDSLMILNHMVMENGKDFHSMTAEEYYSED
jgi:hypothetical protein